MSLGILFTSAIDASDSPLQFRPPHTTGNAYSLVANIFRHDPANAHKNLNEYEPIPSVDNFGVDNFISFLSNDKNFTFYNVKFYTFFSERNVV